MTRHCAWFPRGHTSNVLRERLTRLGGVLPQVPEFGRRIPSRSPRVRRGHSRKGPGPHLRRRWFLSLVSERREPRPLSRVGAAQGPACDRRPRPIFGHGLARAMGRTARPAKGPGGTDAPSWPRARAILAEVDRRATRTAQDPHRDERRKRRYGRRIGSPPNGGATELDRDGGERRL